MPQGNACHPEACLCHPHDAKCSASEEYQDVLLFMGLVNEHYE
jgi:hypothetical protein